MTTHNAAIIAPSATTRPWRLRGVPTPQSVRIQSPRLNAPACTSDRLSTFSCPRTWTRAARLAHPLSSHTGDLPARRIRHQGRDRLVRFGLVLNNPADEIVRRGLCRFEMFERSLRPPNSQMRAMRVPLNVLVWRLAGGSRTTGAPQPPFSGRVIAG